MNSQLWCILLLVVCLAVVEERQLRIVGTRKKGVGKARNEGRGIINDSDDFNEEELDNEKGHEMSLSAKCPAEGSNGGYSILDS